MDITAPIIAGHSLAGITLGTSVEPVLAQAYQQGRKVDLQVFHYATIDLHSYKIDQGVVTVNADAAGTIVSLSCQQPYQGTYQNKLWPGMSITQIIAVSQKQMLLHGSLVVDAEFGVCFDVPYPYDEYDYVHELPKDLVLDNLYVKNSNWWR